MAPLCLSTEPPAFQPLLWTCKLALMCPQGPLKENVSTLTHGDEPPGVVGGGLSRRAVAAFAIRTRMGLHLEESITPY